MTPNESKAELKERAILLLLSTLNPFIDITPAGFKDYYNTWGGREQFRSRGWARIEDGVHLSQDAIVDDRFLVQFWLFCGIMARIPLCFNGLDAYVNLFVATAKRGMITDRFATKILDSIQTDHAQ